MRSTPSAPTVIVVDASVLAVALIDDGEDGDRLRARLRNEDLLAPEIVDLEVVSVFRRHVRAGTTLPRRAELAISDLARLPMRRAPHTPFLARCWELSASMTTYDAVYVALAEASRSMLLTGDRWLASASGPRCGIEVA
jgi:predicted nucleic acid-binding protein